MARSTVTVHFWDQTWSFDQWSSLSASLSRLSWLLLLWLFSYEKNLKQHVWAYAELWEGAQDVKSYPEDVDNPTVVSQYYEVRPSRRVLELQNEDLCIWLTDLSWHFSIVVTIRELPLKGYREKSVANLEASNEAKKQKDSEKQQSQIKHTGIRLGSHISFGNEMFYIDFLGKGIHGDENTVCLWRTTTLDNFCHLTWWCDICHPLFLACVTGKTFLSRLSCHPFFNSFCSRPTGLEA